MIGVSCYKEKMCKENCELYGSEECCPEFVRKENKKIKLEELSCANYKRNKIEEEI